MRSQDKSDWKLSTDASQKIELAVKQNSGPLQPLIDIVQTIFQSLKW
jgi:hypothetical protein